MRRCGLLLLLVGCSSSPAAPDASVAFEYNATAAWSSQATPDVASVTIDGRAVASGEQYSVQETYTSYADAKARFVPHPVIVTTTTGTLTFSIDLGACDDQGAALNAPLIRETDHYDLGFGQAGQTLGFGAYSGSCEGNNGMRIAWAARR